MDFVSAVLSLSQKRDARGNAASMGRPRDGAVGRGGGEGGETARGFRREARAETRAREATASKRGGEGARKRTHTKGRERAGIRRNKRGIFVPAANPNGEERTFLFSLSRQPTYLPLCPRSPRINVARHAAKNRMADPREYIRAVPTLNSLDARLPDGVPRPSPLPVKLANGRHQRR